MATSSGSTSGKYVRLSISVDNIGTNRYRATVSLSASSSYVWNNYHVRWADTGLASHLQNAQRAYVVLNGHKYMIGSSDINGGSFSHGNSFSWDFSISGNASVYGYTICAYCDSHWGHSDGTIDEDKSYFENWTGTINLSYVNPNRPPNTPSITCHNEWVNGKQIAENEIHIELGAVDDPDGNTPKYNLCVQEWKPGDSGWGKSGDNSQSDHGYLLWNSPHRSMVWNIENKPRGTQFRFWGYANDEHWANSGNSNAIANIWRNRTVEGNMWLSPNGGVIHQTIDISWGGIWDPEGKQIKYVVSMSKNGGSYNRLTTTTDTSYRHDTGSDPGGTSYRFNITPNDGFLEANGFWTEFFVKNRPPTVPTNLLPTSGYYNNSVTLSWNASSDPDGLGIEEYHVYINGNRVGQTKSTSYVWNIPAGDAEGTAYKFTIYPIDKSGTSSNATSSSPFYKAHSPSQVSWSGPSDVYHNNSIALTWNPVTSNGVGTKYTITVSTDGGTNWTTLGLDNITGSSYTHNISGYARGTRFIYGIRPINSLGMYGPWNNTKTYYRKNVPPTPSISLANNLDSRGNYVIENAFTVKINQPADTTAKSLRYEIKIEATDQWNINWQTIDTIKTTSNSYEYSISNRPRGYRFRVSVITYDHFDLPSATSNVISNIYRNSPPYAPTGLTPNSGVINTDYVDFKWNASNEPDYQTVKYKLYVSKDSGSYTYLTETTAVSYRLNIANDTPGTKYTFRIIPNDGEVEGSSLTSGVLSKNRLPTKPTNLKPSGYHNKTVTLSWNASTDPDGIGIEYYNIYINGTYITKTSSTSHTWSIPTGDEEGKPYSLRIDAVEYGGGTTASDTAVNLFYKARSPVAVTSISPTSIYHDSSISLSWDKITSNGEDVTYTIEYKINNGGWSIITENLKQTSYNHNISLIDRGAKIKYRIKCINALSMSSPWKESIEYIRKEAPLGPSVKFPVNNTYIHGDSARLAIEVPKEPNGFYQVVYIEVGGNIYNSENNKNMFSKKDGSFKDTTQMVIQVPITGAYSDILLYSISEGVKGEISVHRIYKDSVITGASAGQNISASLINNISEKINVLRVGHGLSRLALAVGANNFIKQSELINIRSAINDIRTKLNSHDSSNTNLDVTYSWSSCYAGDPIRAYYINELIDSMKNI